MGRALDKTLQATVPSGLRAALFAGLVASASVLVVGAGCAPSNEGTTAAEGSSAACAAGTSQACACPSGGGSQTCSDGRSWGACDCGSGLDASTGPSPGSDGGSTGMPDAPSEMPDGGANGESASCTVLTGTTGSVRDASGAVWTLATGTDGSLVVDTNGAAAGYTDQVFQLAYVNHVVSQENASKAWWSWTGGGWVSGSDPTRACHSDGGAAAHDGGVPTGNFHIENGQIIDPNGKVWVGRGINIYDSQLTSASDASGNPLLSLFPKLGIVRVPCYSYTQDTPAFLQAFVDEMTSRGIVVELEDHISSDGSNAGGSSGAVFTGAQLSDELSWYASLSTAFAGNPYVWFGTDNEPSENPSAAALSTWQQQTYQAIRNAGNSNIVLVEMNCDTSNCGAGYTGALYGAMSNIVWDMHYYGWLTNYATDQATADQTLATLVKSAQGITSSDGTIAIVIGEYGNS